MAEGPTPLAANAAAAATTLRETTKWLVAGVVATAAGVFAGTSLTNLGSLDPVDDMYRLGLAAGGAGLGFVALAIILTHALPVLTAEQISIRMLAGDPRLAATAAIIDDHYFGQWPAGASNVAEFSARIDEAFENRSELANAAFLANAARLTPDMLAEARFLYLKARFDSLVRSLWLAVPLAVIGFGLFAWAANPGEPAGEEAAPVLIVNRA